MSATIDATPEAASDASTLPALPDGFCRTPEGQVVTRLEAKALCKTAFQAGTHRLAQLAAAYGIPYSTLTKWSHEEKWSVQAVEVRQEAGKKAESQLAEWLAEQQVEQMKRAVTRARAVQRKADELLQGVEKAQELRDLATVEEKADAILRRNLNMNDGGGSSGAKVSVNILSGNVHLQAEG